MSAEENLTPEKKQDSFFVDALKKNSVTITMAVLFALYTFFWNSHDSARDLKNQVDAMDKTIARMQKVDEDQAKAQTDTLIAMTKMSEALNRLAQDVGKIQEQQQKNTDLLLNRK